jgi:hypothetical protein
VIGSGAASILPYHMQGDVAYMAGVWQFFVQPFVLPHKFTEQDEKCRLLTKKKNFVA